MADFKKRGGFGGGFRGGNKSGFSRPGSFGGSRGGDRESRGPIEMHSATCASCHNPCEVPFRPSGDRPVYCNACFGKNKAAGAGMGAGDFQNRGDRKFSNDRGRRDFTGAPSNFNAPATSSAGAAPVVSAARPIESGILIDLKKQIDAVNAKLDRVMEYMKNPGSILLPKVAVASSEVKSVEKVADVKSKKMVAKKATNKKVVAKK